MLGTIANLKENLNKIALDVHEDNDDDEVLALNGLGNGEATPISDRRNSHRFAHSNSVSRSPLSNGIDSPRNSEIEQYKAEIKRLQESEAEIKALSVNYAALLKGKEDQISRLNRENGSLKQNLDAINAALSLSKNENSQASTNSINVLKGSCDLSPSRQNKLTAQVKNRHAGNQMQNGVLSKKDRIGNGVSDTVQPDISQSKMENRNSTSQGKEKELADLLEEKNRSLAQVQATHELQTKQLRLELEKEREKLANLQLKLQEEQKLNESFQEELKSLKMDKEKSSIEMSKIHREMSEKLSEINRLQLELNRREDEDADDISEKLAMAPEEEDSVPMTEDVPKSTETTETNRASVEATIQSLFEGGIESTGNEEDGETSGVPDDGDQEKKLEFSNDLIQRGTKALGEKDFGEAAECFSRALEIRVGLYGELAPECLNAYYQYGRALLYRAQEEADPLVSVPKKEDEFEVGSEKDGSVHNLVNGESSTASASTNTQLEVTENDVSGGKGKEEDEEGSDQDGMDEADEDESDLDLAWKTLDVARAIAEKHLSDTLEKVDILSTLAEVSLEREDFETSLSDYQNALSILVLLVEPDSRHIAELNFRICLCLEFGSKPQEAIPYCEKAISICKSRVQRLMNEYRSLSQTTSSEGSSEQSSNKPQNDQILADMKAEIDTLLGLLGDLEKKHEDLQQLVLNPKSFLTEFLAMASAKGKGNEKGTSASVINSSQMGAASSGGEYDSPTASTAHTNGAAGAGVMHLGTVGRGVKRVSMASVSGESSSTKKPTFDRSSDMDEGDKN